MEGMLEQAEAGDAEVLGTLGEAFADGFGTERDEVRAEEFLRRAAEAGRVESMTRLGSFLGRDWRSEAERVEALEWFRRAAALGDARAMTLLGFAYREGRGVAADADAAVGWFISAHAAGAAGAASVAGRILAERVASHAAAVEWLHKGIEEGNPDCYHHLALIHENRSSPAYDPQAAFRAWLQVAQRPRADLRLLALRQLAVSCRDGIGTEPDRGQAIRWLDRLIALAPAGKRDHRRALKLRREIAEDLL